MAFLLLSHSRGGHATGDPRRAPSSGPALSLTWFIGACCVLQPALCSEQVERHCWCVYPPVSFPDQPLCSRILSPYFLDRAVQ